MQRRHIGQTKLEVTAIGLGCWQFSQGQGLGGRFWPTLKRSAINEIVRTALDGGINWFDTAEAYGNGRSEALLAHALRKVGKRDSDVVIATKWQPFFRSAGSIARTFDLRQANLNGFTIDLHQVHAAIGSLSSHAAQMRVMSKLVEQGKVSAVGVSNFSGAQMVRCALVLEQRGLCLASNQVKYSLLDRRIERSGVLAAAKNLGCSIIAYSPLAQGLLSGKFHDDPQRIRRRTGPRRWLPAFRKRGLARSWPVVEELRRIGAKHQATAAQIALAWLTQFHGERVVAIPGATTFRHAEEAAGALYVSLSPGDLKALDQVSRCFL